MALPRGGGCAAGGGDDNGPVHGGNGGGGGVGTAAGGGVAGGRRRPRGTGGGGPADGERGCGCPGRAGAALGVTHSVILGSRLPIQRRCPSCRAPSERMEAFSSGSVWRPGSMALRRAPVRAGQGWGDAGRGRGAGPGPHSP